MPVSFQTDGIQEVKAHSIVDGKGVEREVDCIIYGTGFKVSDPIGPMQIIGKGGEEIRDTWNETGMEAYLGISVSGFPNFFMLLGPNTGLGHTSIVFMIGYGFSRIRPDTSSHSPRRTILPRPVAPADAG